MDISINDMGPTPPPSSGDDSSADVNNTQSTGSTQSQDTIESGGPSSSNSTTLTGSIDLTGRVNYIDYLARVGKPLLAARQLEKETAEHDFSSETIKRFILSILKDVENARAFRRQVLENGAGVTDLRDQQNAQITALNTATTAYNANVQSQNAAIQALNTEIAKFNNGQISEAELRAAITTYNNYATTHNAAEITDVNAAINTYNQQVAANNQQIDIINTQRLALGLPPIQHQVPLANVPDMTTIDLPVQPLTPPLGTLPQDRTTVPKVPKYTNPPTQEDLNNLVDAAMEAAENASALLGDKITLIQDAAEFKRFKAQGKQSTRPPAFIEHYNDRSPAGRGGSTFGLSFFLAQSSPGLLGTLSLSNYKNSLSEFGEPLPRETQYSANAITNSTLNAAGVNAAAGFNELQSELGVNAQAGTPAGDLLLSLAFARNVSQVNSDTEVQSQIDATFSEDASIAALPPDQQQQALASIRGGIQLTLSLTALLQIAIAANSPGLVAQILGQVVPGAAGSLQEPSTTEQFNQALGSGVTQEELRGILQQLAGRFGGNGAGAQAALENTLLFGAQFTSPSGVAPPGTPLLGGDGSPLLGADGQPLTVPDGNVGGPVQTAGARSAESVRNSLLGISDVLAGFKPTVTAGGSSSAGASIAGFAFTSEGQFFSQLSQNLAQEGFNSVAARNLAVEATLSLINQIAIPGIIGRDLDQQVGLAGGAALGKVELQNQITQGTDSQTQLNAAVQASLQKDNVETVRQLRDEIVRQLVARQIGFDQALLLANNSAQVAIGAERAQGNFATNSIDEAAVEAALSSELTKRGISASQANNAVIQAFNQSSALTSEELFRDTLSDSIVQQGITDSNTAASIASAIQIQRRAEAGDALRAPGLLKQLSPEELAQELQTSLIAQLSGQIGQEQALRLTGAIVREVVGFEVTEGQPKRNPSSIPNQIASAIELGIRINNDQREAQRADDFRAFSSPNIDLFTIIQAKLDPANSILMSSATGIMYDQSPGGSTFQTPGSSRAPSPIAG